MMAPTFSKSPRMHSPAEFAVFLAPLVTAGQLPNRVLSTWVVSLPLLPLFSFLLLGLILVIISHLS